jgi:hypothetical protein
MLKDQKQRKASLDDLPSSNDTEFWAEADIHTGIVPHDELSETGHYFERVTGHQAQCRHCDWGFQLDTGDKIIDGHLYTKEGKFVI